MLVKGKWTGAQGWDVKVLGATGFSTLMNLRHVLWSRGKCPWLLDSGSTSIIYLLGELE